MAVYTHSLLTMTALDEMEDQWWMEKPKLYASYNEVPASAKWLFRLAIDDPPQSAARLEVWADHRRHLLPESYIPLLMLLSIQELSCMAESFSQHVNPRKRAELWRNIHFIWLLRDNLLISPTTESFANPNCIFHPILDRWSIRLIHGISNSKAARKGDSEKLCRLYLENCGAGRLDQGVSHYICC